MDSVGEVRLRACGLSVGYDGTALVADVGFELHAGEICTLIGPNGAGKSTLLKTLSRHLEPVCGLVEVSGRPLTELAPKELSLTMSVVLTDRLRTELLTCADIVETGRYPHTGRLGVPRERDRLAVREAMELSGVWELRDRDFMQVSDGQRQRVLLARAIAQHPRVLLLDEPTSFLDIRYQIELLEVLRHLAHERGVAVIMSLHELSLARIVSDTLLCVKDGGVLFAGKPEQVFTSEVIDELYGLEPGTYDPRTGEISLPRSPRGAAPGGPCR